MSYITKDQLNLYLQKVNTQSTGPGINNGTTRSRSTLTGPRPPTFGAGAKANSRKIFQDGPPSHHHHPPSSSHPTMHPSPITPTNAQMENAVKDLSLTSIPGPNPRPPSPILESMGEVEPILESMGRDDFEIEAAMRQQQQHQAVVMTHSQQHFGTMNGPHPQQQQGYGPGHSQTWSAPGYAMGPHQQNPGVYGNQPIPPQFYQNYHNASQQQQQQPLHLSQEQYLRLQQEQLQHQQQQQVYIRQQHASHAAAHGYHPTPTSSTHLPHPTASQMLNQPVTTTSKTITPRIVPIVEIPKYTIVNPPKAEIIDEPEEDDNDDDWAPEPPPRDVPRKSAAKPSRAVAAPTEVEPPSRAYTPNESTFMANPPTPPKVDILTTTTTTATALASPPLSAPSTEIDSSPTEEEREPLPPPREFRRKSPASPIIPPSAYYSLNSTSARPSPNSIFKPSPSSSPSSTPTGISSSKKQGVPIPGTVRANSAKFNAMAAAGTSSPSSVGNDHSNSNNGNKPNAKPSSPRADSSILSSTDTSVPTKASSASAAASQHRKSPGTSMGTAASRRKPVAVIPPETYANKELPPLKPETPPIQAPFTSSSSFQQDHHNSSPPPITMLENPNPVGYAHYDEDHDSKCIVTEEDTAGVIPRADDFSKEILVEQEEQKNLTTPVNSSPSSVSLVEERPMSPPVKPARSGSSNSGSKSLGARAGTSSASGSSGSGSSHQTGYTCSSCEEPISGMMITAMGKRWHSDHFVCCVCDQNLEHIQFFQKDGQPYCHLDYHDKFSPKCGHCDSAIENECLTALGKSWHPGHFFCRECGDPFDEDGYMVHEDFPYCEKDYLRLFAPKCAACQDPIQGDFISALKGKWHRDCFGCTVCHIGFDAASYYVENGKPYCQAHYKTGAAQSAAE